MMKKCTPSAKQHEFNNKNRIVCVWEAPLVKAVSLNLTQPFLHVIPFLSYFLHLCIDKYSQTSSKSSPSTYTLGKSSHTKLLQTQSEDEVLIIFSSISDSFMTLIMTIKSYCGRKEQKQSWHKINPNLSDSAELLFDSPAGYKLYISVSNAEIKQTVYSSAGYRASDLPHCLAAWMSWQLALVVLMVPLLPTNECRQEFKGHIEK